MPAATLEKATENVKNYMAELKGADTEVSGRKLIDWLDFDLLDTEKDESGNYILKIEMKQNIFSEERKKYRVAYNPETGKINDVERIGR